MPLNELDSRAMEEMRVNVFVVRVIDTRHTKTSSLSPPLHHHDHDDDDDREF